MVPRLACLRPVRRPRCLEVFGLGLSTAGSSVRPLPGAAAGGLTRGGAGRSMSVTAVPGEREEPAGDDLLRAGHAGIDAVLAAGRRVLAARLAAGLDLSAPDGAGGAGSGWRGQLGARRGSCTRRGSLRTWPACGPGVRGLLRAQAGRAPGSGWSIGARREPAAGGCGQAGRGQPRGQLGTVACSAPGPAGDRRCGEQPWARGAGGRGPCRLLAAGGFRCASHSAGASVDLDPNQVLALRARLEDLVRG